MGNLTEQNLINTVLEKLEGAKDPRFKQVMSSLIKHLHAFVRETELTEAEWLTGIQFLTATGKKCDDKRQEYILLSDTLGVSMLVDAINHRKPGGATETTVLGPFYVSGAKDMPMWADIAGNAPGVPAYVSGRVLDVSGKPIAGAMLDVWQTDGEGFYDVQRPGGNEHYTRGRFTTGADGRYGFRTVKPVSYPVPTDGPVGRMLLGMGRHPYRPAHVHVIATSPGYDRIATHLFVEGDEYLDSDAVFGVKHSLVVDFKDHPAGPTPDGKKSSAPFCTAEFDFRLVRS
ncbi:MAG: intradiol ring-cleavage dioxygenase [Betaproteobacteria bacterium]|nr:intradiol ring-cleavage dioxygenase [Betaproteobacteria bacterium]